MPPKDYAVIGVLQQGKAPDEWVMVHDAVSASSRLGAIYAGAVEAFRRQSGDAGRKNKSYPRFGTLHELQLRHDWNFWVIAVVELAPGLPVLSCDTLEPLEQIREGVSGDHYPGGGLRPNVYVMAGQGGGGDGWVQRFRGSSVKGAIDTVDDWVEGEEDRRGVDWEYEGLYGIVEEKGPGHYVVYDGEGNVTSVVTGPAAGAQVSSSDVSVINRYRARMGRDPIDLGAGWSHDELRQMAERIRTTGREANPAALKRRLTRR